MTCARFEFLASWRQVSMFGRLNHGLNSAITYYFFKIELGLVAVSLRELLTPAIAGIDSQLTARGARVGRPPPHWRAKHSNAALEADGR